jgi:hypothetical protein
MVKFSKKNAFFFFWQWQWQVASGSGSGSGSKWHCSDSCYSGLPNYVAAVASVKWHPGLTLAY